MRLSAGPGVRVRMIAVLAAALAAAGISVVTPGQHGVAGASPGPATDRPGGFAPFSVTLITGDRVQVRSVGGRYSTSVTAGPGRAGMAFSTRAYGDMLEVVPADAMPLLAADKLDRRLFNLLELRRLGYHDGARGDIPVLVTGARPAGAAGSSRRTAPAAARLPGPRAGAREVAVLPLAGVRSLRADKRSASAFWAATKAAAAGQSPGPGARSAPGDAAGSAPGAVGEKTWLVGKRRLSLDRSARQVGAPSAWKAGWTGKGVTVAVLDTGYDTRNPDLKGVVRTARDFTGTGIRDTVGHGTHVASIVAGRGTASGGKYVGVARDARLAVGKVCPDQSCPDDLVLAGMEWAAGTGAKVVNMSLGGGSGAADDPLEQAVETLTARTGTLFVTAAGNSGPGERTVGSPATAPSALAVGSVDRDDAVSDFSSRGPAVADTGAGPRRVKPEITAPGNGIVAARSAGSDLGAPVGERYMTLSGTSMAAPHVAGAAAILAGQNPGWSPARIKARLTSTAAPTPGASVYDQGAGRLDLARATRSPLTADTGVLDLGSFPWPNATAAPVTRTVTYTNTGRKALTLRLTTGLTGPDGRPAPRRALTSDKAGLTLAPGRTGTVTLTFRPAAVRPGLYSGRLTATTADGTIRATTALGAYREPEAYDLTVTTLGRDGKPQPSSLTLLHRRGGEVTAVVGSASRRLPPGRYVMTTAVYDGTTDATLAAREFTVSRATRVTVDARAGRTLDVRLDRTDAEPTDAASVSVGIDVDGFPYWQGGMGSPGDLHVIPSAKITGLRGGTNFGFAKRGSGDPSEGRTPSPFTAAAVVSFGNRLPATPVFRLRKAQSATVHNRYLDIPSGQEAATVVSGISEDTGQAVAALVPLGGLRERTDYVYTNRTGVLWLRDLFRIAPGREDASVSIAPAQTYEPGRTYRDTWGRGVLGPATEGDPDGGLRDGDLLYGFPELLVDAAGHKAFAFSDSGRVRLLRNGTEVWSTDWTEYPYFFADVPAAGATYRLEVTMQRQQPWSTPSGRQSVAWTFRSGHVDGEQPLPLSMVRYLPTLDDRNAAPAGQVFTVPVRVERAAGSTAAPLKSLAVEVSYDGGSTWAAAEVSGTGQERTLRLTHPAGADGVSFRATAVDTAGNKVEQTVIDAYRLR